jgi:hypothetical protein
MVGPVLPYRVGIEEAVAVSVITHLHSPIVRHVVPDLLGFFQLAVAPRSFSCVTPAPPPDEASYTVSRLCNRQELPSESGSLSLPRMEPCLGRLVMP